MPRKRPQQRAARARHERRVGAVEDVESKKLVEPDHPIEVSARGRMERAGKQPIGHMIGQAPAWQNRNTESRAQKSVAPRGEDANFMTAILQNSRKLHAIALQSSFREKPNNAERDPQRWSFPPRLQGPSDARTPDLRHPGRQSPRCRPHLRLGRTPGTRPSSQRMD